MVPLAYFGIESSGLNLVIDLSIVFVVVVYLSLIYWTYMDARRRIEDPMMIGCGVAASLFPFAGTIVYVILRPPEYLEDVRERALEIQAAQARLYELDSGSCPHCAYRIERDFIRCPSCLRKLKERCTGCGRPLDRSWSICPYCEAEVPDSAPLRRRRRRRQVDDPGLSRQLESDPGLSRQLRGDPGPSRELDSDVALPPASALGDSSLEGSTLEDPLQQPSSLDGGPALSAGSAAPVLRDDRRDDRSRRSRPTVSSADGAEPEEQGPRPYAAPDQTPPRPRSGRARYPRSSS